MLVLCSTPRATRRRCRKRPLSGSPNCQVRATRIPGQEVRDRRVCPWSGDALREFVRYSANPGPRRREVIDITMLDEKVEAVYAEVVRRNPGAAEFHQTVRDVL